MNDVKIVEWGVGSDGLMCPKKDGGFCEKFAVDERIAALEAEVSNQRFALTDALVREDALKAQVERQAQLAKVVNILAAKTGTGE